MANELRKRADFVAGGLDVALAVGDTTMSSPGLIDLPPIDSSEFSALALFRTDTAGRVTQREIVWCIAHTVGMGTCTIVRGREGTSPQTWAIGDRWTHSQTARDITVICTSGTRPVNPHIGLEIYENDTTSKKVWDGTAWQQIGGIPVGTIIWRPKTTAVPGYLRCDGSLKDRTTYADLYAYLGFDASPTPGTDPGSNQFYVPNTKGKVFVDLDAAQTEFDTALKAGGSKTSTAAHTHSLSAHTHSISVTVNGNNFNTDTRDTNHAHNVYARNQNTGGQSDNHAHAARTDAQQVDQGWPAGGHLAVRTTDRTSQLTWAGTIQGCSQTGNNSVYQDHVHNFTHDHPSTNYQSESPWAGNYTHYHNANHAHTASGSAGAPSNDTSGASSVGATSGNLQPYTTMVAFIKF